MSTNKTSKNNKYSHNKESYFFRLLDITLPLPLLYISIAMFPPVWGTRYLVIGLISGLLFVFIANFQGLYQKIARQNVYKIAVQLAKNWFLIGLFIITSAFFTRYTEFLARHILLVWIIMTPVVLFTYRIILRKLFLSENINILVIGKNYKFSSYELERLQQQKISLIYCDKTIEKIKHNITTKDINYILINHDNTEDELIKFLIKVNLEGISYFTIEHFMEVYLRKYYIPKKLTKLDYLDNIKTYNNKQLIIKNIIDYIAIIFLGLFSLLVSIYITYRIKRESPGEIIFKQIRIGKNNKKFTIHKFRSMHTNQVHNPYTKKNDDRLFPFGETMRKLRIDELPQLLNVLKKDIHIVGPRAEWNILIQEYEKEIPYYSERHIIKPGITGWAQVNYPYGANTEDARQKLMYDLYYIKNWNFALELETISKTIKVILTKQGL